MNYLIPFLFLFFVIGCEQKPQVRQYTEIIIETSQMPTAPMLAMANSDDPHAGLDMSKAPIMPTANDEVSLTWLTPKGWEEVAGQGMRLVSFRLKDNPEAIDVSVISLGGMAGGLEANLTRWASQIQLDITESQLQSFIKKSQDNIFDFTQLQKGADPQDKSTIAAMLTLNSATVFVKMTGSVEMVTAHKDAFITLVQSIKEK